MTDIVSLSATPGGAAAGTSWAIDAPVPGAPRPSYRAVRYLRLAPSGADALEVHDGTVFTGSFSPTTFDALNPGGSLPAAQVKPTGGDLIVQLDAPRQVTRVGLDPAVASSSSVVQLFRLDNDVLATQPTVQVGNGLTLPADFTDRRFAIRLSDGTNSIALASGDLTSASVTSFPTGARLGLADPATLDQAPPTFFFQVAGEIGRDPTNGLPSATDPRAAVDAGAALGKALQTYLDAAMAAAASRVQSGAAAAMPDVVDVALIVQSDAPCGFNLNGLNISYSNVLQSFPGGEPKQVLRFPGPGAQSASVRLPAGAVVQSAQLQASVSIRRDRPADGSGDVLANAGAPGTTGVYLNQGSWMAQPLEIEQAIAAAGLILGVLTVAAPVDLRVELQSDSLGRPSGNRLAGGAAGIAVPGRRAWIRIPFDREVVLPAQSYWLVVTCARGAAVWLAKPGDSSIQVLDKPDATSGWVPRGELQGLQGLAQVYARAGGSPDVPLVILSLGDQTVPPGPNSGNRQTFEFSAALNAYAESRSSADPLSVALTFTVAAPGLITVYPPRIVYVL